MDRQVKQLNVLNDFELVGRQQTKLANFSSVKFVYKRFVDSLRRKWLTDLTLMALLTATSRFLAPIQFLPGRLDDVA